jgi:tetratricopeptide (TPR) repeat protein
MRELGWEHATIKTNSLIYVYKGKYKYTLQYLNENRHSDNEKVKDEAKKTKMLFYALLGDTKNAALILSSYKQEILGGSLLYKKDGDTYIADSLLKYEIPFNYYNGYIDDALVLCNKVEDEIIKNNLGGGYEYQLAQMRGDILYGSNQLSEAATAYEKLISENYWRKAVWFYRLADCYFRQKMYEEAREVLLQVNMVYEPMSIRPGIAFGYSFPRTFYLLGRSNEELGLQNQAIEAYSQFLGIWKEADEDLPELIDARKRSAVLSGITENGD